MFDFLAIVAQCVEPGSMTQHQVHGSSYSPSAPESGERNGRDFVSNNCHWTTTNATDATEGEGVGVGVKIMQPVTGGEKTFPTFLFI